MESLRKPSGSTSWSAWFSSTRSVPPCVVDRHRLVEPAVLDPQVVQDPQRLPGEPARAPGGAACPPARRSPRAAAPPRARRSGGTPPGRTAGPRCRAHRCAAQAPARARPLSNAAGPGRLPAALADATWSGATLAGATSGPSGRPRGLHDTALPRGSGFPSRTAEPPAGGGGGRGAAGRGRLGRHPDRRRAPEPAGEAGPARASVAPRLLLAAGGSPPRRPGPDRTGLPCERRWPDLAGVAAPGAQFFGLWPGFAGSAGGMDFGSQACSGRRAPRRPRSAFTDAARGRVPAPFARASGGRVIPGHTQTLTGGPSFRPDPRPERVAANAGICRRSAPKVRSATTSTRARVRIGSSGGLS